jgi:hypothetical protein
VTLHAEKPGPRKETVPGEQVRLETEPADEAATLGGATPERPPSLPAAVPLACGSRLVGHSVSHQTRQRIRRM